MEARVAEQAQVAMEAADLVLLVVDSTVGVTAADLEVAELLRGATAPVITVVNKVDKPHDPVATADFYSLGLGEPVAVSALHGHGSGDLLDRIVASLPLAEPSMDEAWASVAVVGRPNVGKSSLANALIRQERSLVDARAGTTRDPITSYLELDDGRRIAFVDTAGMRKEVRIKDPVEYFSWLRSRGTLFEVDAALLVIDASEGVTGSDQRLAREVMEAGRACVVALTKWDLITSEGAERDRFEAALLRDLRFLDWATVRRTSAVTRRGIDRLPGDLTAAIGSHRARIPTGELNRSLSEATGARPHPRTGGRAIRVLYAVQPKVAPPTIVLFANGRLTEPYLRYLERSLRAEHGLQGTPLRLQVRIKSRP